MTNAFYIFFFRGMISRTDAFEIEHKQIIKCLFPSVDLLRCRAAPICNLQL